MTELIIENEISNGKNTKCVRCQFCNSLMLAKQQGTYLQQDEEIKLPTIHAKNTKNLAELETESMKDFWQIGDMFEFENIGFSNNVGNLKYLICADCDMGPVGYQNVGISKTCYLALSRVKHEN